ncbi:PREDICTED: UPF0481 protein At3g47200-like [Nelumbo nucifera]|uniref:UPF0481 protein At3g47200-like n=2 Tax=Nelumbo nucifera TaxID=4432 RepID=A0A1U7ZQH4_NELNU|nr:PREDICTED: UPF0481 protein At3g47200-like [Nelumbo nucifera]DAD34016.1 TPA_asm: hypothetical protein HUJ06_004656 [Nelumbo nucifera]
MPTAAAAAAVDDDECRISSKEMEWVVQIKEKVEQMADTSKEMQQWKKRSIYKVPACVTDLNKKAYRPQSVSFGPYHHGEERLKPMEDHKHRALLHFLKRSNKSIHEYVKALQSVVQQLKDCYDSLASDWHQDTNKFLQLMLLDGCFMLEVLRTDQIGTSDDDDDDDYPSNDPIFSRHGTLHFMPYIRRDMLMIENQLPMLVLEKLLAVETGKPIKDEVLNRMIIKFWGPNTPVPKGKCLHVLDAYRKSLLEDESHKKKQKRKSTSAHSNDYESTGEIIRSATELYEAGIRFKKSKTGSLRDITFHGGVLKLPLIVVDDVTESMFLNLMAFERLHVGAGNEITSYIFFMDNIIDNAKDVSLLHSSGIIQNALGSDKGVAKLFNQLSKDVTLDPESGLDVVHKKVHDYCKKRWNEWRANLIHTYFRSPWAILSLIAAIVLMALTIAQTVYTIYPFYHDSNN